MKKVIFLALSIALTSINIHPVAADDLGLIGPGERLHGADVSRWQHPNDKPINFKKMHDAGLSFVMIKASDTRYDSDRLALKYVKMDRTAAQAAGIYTGFYHYAILPNVSSPAAIAKDARAQAQKVVWRLSDLGGYNEMDLPYALNLGIAFDTGRLEYGRGW